MGEAKYFLFPWRGPWKRKLRSTAFNAAVVHPKTLEMKVSFYECSWKQARRMSSFTLNGNLNREATSQILVVTMETHSGASIA